MNFYERIAVNQSFVLRLSCISWMMSMRQHFSVSITSTWPAMFERFRKQPSASSEELQRSQSRHQLILVGWVGAWAARMMAYRSHRIMWHRLTQLTESLEVTCCWFHKLDLGWVAYSLHQVYRDRRLFRQLWCASMWWNVDLGTHPFLCKCLERSS